MLNTSPLTLHALRKYVEHFTFHTLRFTAASYTLHFTLYSLRGKAMPAIASLEDLKSAQKDLQEAKDLNESRKVALKEVTQSSVLVTQY